MSALRDMAAGLSGEDLEREWRTRVDERAHLQAQLAVIETELTVLADELCARAGRAGRTGVVVRLPRRLRG